eukprot:m.110521 g.110521  ORF g.110521 m.110521 type:complete len:68 (+) comp21311_c0_seq1:118-321(+)
MSQHPILFLAPLQLAPKYGTIRLSFQRGSTGGISHALHSSFQLPNYFITFEDGKQDSSGDPIRRPPS